MLELVRFFEIRLTGLYRVGTYIEIPVTHGGGVSITCMHSFFRLRCRYSDSGMLQVNRQITSGSISRVQVWIYNSSSYSGTDADLEQQQGADADPMKQRVERGRGPRR